MMAVGASPGMAKERTGAEHPDPAMLQLSLPISPACFLPLPNFSGSLLMLLA